MLLAYAHRQRSGTRVRPTRGATMFSTESFQAAAAKLARKVLT
jgi:hypothetical protein